MTPTCYEIIHRTAHSEHQNGSAASRRKAAVITCECMQARRKSRKSGGCGTPASSRPVCTRDCVFAQLPYIRRGSPDHSLESQTSSRRKLSPACKEYVDAMHCTQCFLTKGVASALRKAARCETVQLTCRASTFFRVPGAHAFLNGLVRGFWRMACWDAKSNEKLTKGKDVIISKAEQKKIASNVARMHPTSQFDNGFKNMLQNEPTVPAHYQRDVTCSTLNNILLHKVLHELKISMNNNRPAATVKKKMDSTRRACCAQLSCKLQAAVSHARTSRVEGSTDVNAQACSCVVSL
jgi:hypothetical protein